MKSWLYLLACFCIGCGPSTHQAAPTLRVFCAASTQEATRMIARDFENKHACKVHVIADDSARLAAQIEQGAPADLFLSAHPRWTEHLLKQGLVLRQSPLLSNQLVLVTARTQSVASQPSPGRPIEAWLNDPVLKRIAIAGENVPAGIYARQTLQSLDLLDSLEKENRLVMSESVRAVLALVEHGEADAGFIYATDVALTSRIVKLCDVPENLHEPIVYVLAQTAKSTESDELYSTFMSQTAQNTFQSFGFTSPLVATP